MSIETEKKYRLDRERRESVLLRLKELGANHIGPEFEENTIFSNDDLRSRGAIVRIRKTPQRVLLTYKRRTHGSSDIKQQLEYETEVENAEAMRAIIGELGLKPVLVYEKRRDTWKFRSVEVVFDELPFGSFMEIEGPVAGIREAEMLLDLEDLEAVHETYPALTARSGIDNGGVTESRFS